MSLFTSAPLHHPIYTNPPSNQGVSTLIPPQRHPPPLTDQHPCNITALIHHGTRTHHKTHSHKRSRPRQLLIPPWPQHPRFQVLHLPQTGLSFQEGRSTNTHSCLVLFHLECLDTWACEILDSEKHDVPGCPYCRGPVATEGGDSAGAQRRRRRSRAPR